jgi:hypothetical protein
MWMSIDDAPFTRLGRDLIETRHNLILQNS